MGRRQKRAFTAEFKAEAVKMVTEQRLSMSQVCRDLDVSFATLQRWIEKSKTSPFSSSPSSNLSDSERAELERLRHEVRNLRMERENI